MKIYSKFYVKFQRKVGIRHTVPRFNPSQQTQDVSWMYIRRSEDVRDVFWTSYVRSIYVLYLRRWLLVVLAKSKKPLRYHSQITWPAAGRSVAWFFCLTWARACIFLLNKILVKTMPSKFHGLCTKN